MPENARVGGCLDEINLEFVEREATPKLLTKLSIQLHLAGLSLSNTVLFLEIFGVDRVRSTVHNWVHKADSQPESGRSPNYVAVDETVIRLNDEQYWLYRHQESTSKLFSSNPPQRTQEDWKMNKNRDWKSSQDCLPRNLPIVCLFTQTAC